MTSKLSDGAPQIAPTSYLPNHRFSCFGDGNCVAYFVEKARLVYFESLAATQYLVDRKGRQALTQLLDLLARRQTMNDALNRVIGLDYQELQIAWEADLSRYRPTTREAR